MPVGPTRRADSSTSMPPPEPRSRTVSPGFNWARAVGLPQPRLARTAVSGSSASSAPYRLPVIGSAQWASAGAPPQQELEPPATTRNAACPYFSLTTSVMFSLGMMTFSLFADRNDGFRLHCLVPRAAFGIEEAE